MGEAGARRRWRGGEEKDRGGRGGVGGLGELGGGKRRIDFQLAQSSEKSQEANLHYG